jgi:hypothetical protein
MEWEEAFEIFLAAQNYAKIQLEEATESDKQYWQGVKDGLRKCYAIFTNDPGWMALGGGSPQERPEAYREFARC